jgi:hypothetical protein
MAQIRFSWRGARQGFQTWGGGGRPGITTWRGEARYANLGEGAARNSYDRDEIGYGGMLTRVASEGVGGN